MAFACFLPLVVSVIVYVAAGTTETAPDTSRGLNERDYSNSYGDGGGGGGYDNSNGGRRRGYGRRRFSLFNWEFPDLSAFVNVLSENGDDSYSSNEDSSYGSNNNGAYGNQGNSYSSGNNDGEYTTRQGSTSSRASSTTPQSYYNTAGQSYSTQSTNRTSPSPTRTTVATPGTPGTPGTPVTQLPIPAACGTVGVGSNTDFFDSNRILSLAARTNKSITMHHKGGIIVPTIIGGTNAKVNQMCWQVLVVARTVLPDNKGVTISLCGGSIIGSRTILTAAHCVFNADLTVRTANNLAVRIGAMDNKLGNPVGCEEDFRVAKVIPHSLYVASAPNATMFSSNNDVALLTLARDIDFVKSRCACRLCLEDRVPDVNAQCIASGVGNQQVDQPVDASIDVVLQYAVLDVKSQTSDDCTGTISALDNPNLFVCAGGAARGTATCQGDSGGPLACLDAGGKFYSAGVTSYGTNGCPKNQPAHFAKTQAYLAWIRINADPTDALSFV
ncbi:hypothetical protein BV898_00336 [Hypsibius exemplaris]|uniref:Peptidase S1 domain-containing protein n=1 Tax=Hypsibius exemplaris TaxID=2072580 RepID=A0A1W0XFH3_HYPEX|nr:hypothetical protein BV898_00336 [Hypsibius exemplaris]